MQESIASKMRELHRSLEQAKDETRTSHNDLLDRLDVLENKVIDAERERSVLYKRQLDTEYQVKEIKMHSVGEKGMRD